MSRKANLFVVSAASGTGKTTLTTALINSSNDIVKSISYTTRSPRKNEKDNEDYFFVSPSEFERMIAAHDFLEYAKVFDYYYGTGSKFVKSNLENGVDVLLEIDWQGAMQVKKNMPDAITIFILPPSLADLRKRLFARNQDKEEVIEKRLRGARFEISHALQFDYIFVNDKFEQALLDLKSIINASRLKREIQINNLEKLIQDET